MITVKFFGLLRLDHGIRTLQLEAETMAQVFSHLESLGIPRRELKGCVVFLNGSPANKRSVLKDGDQVIFMSPVAGG